MSSSSSSSLKRARDDDDRNDGRKNPRLVPAEPELIGHCLEKYPPKIKDTLQS